MTAFASSRRWEMSITRADFLRLLPAAVGSQDAGLEGASGDVAWRLELAERDERRIASLAMPVLDVRLDLRASGPEAAERFVERFLRAYQRAGG